jgi:hypothetical protein
VKETAEILKVSPETVQRDWKLAKSGLRRELAGGTRVESERWRKVEDLYHSALELDRHRRAAFVKQGCGGDEALRSEVESLLAQAEDTEGFLETPALEVAARSLAMPPASGSPSHPSVIGRYRIIRLLGDCTCAPRRNRSCAGCARRKRVCQLASARCAGPRAA